MKKILLATTVLAATAGVASAEMAVTGSARMGVASKAAVAASAGYAAAKTAADAAAATQAATPSVGNLAALNAANAFLATQTAASSSGVEFTSRFRVSFTGSGETDNGLSFGGSVRNDQLGVGNTKNGDSTLFISGAFGKITMGDVSGAADSLVGQVSSVGLTGLGSLNEISFLSNKKTAALYTYTAGALTFGLGIGQPTGLDKARSVAVKYSTDMYTVALGYEDTATQKRTSIKGSTTFSGVTLNAKLASNDVRTLGQTKNTAYAVSADYAMSGVNLTTFFSSGAGYLCKSGDASCFDGVEAFGVGAAYDLGGGAVVKGGIAKVNNGSDAIFDLGVAMSF